MATNGRFEDRTALVTGGAHGIGRAAVARLLDEGARVAVADRDADQAEQTVVALAAGADPADGPDRARGARLLALGCDVTDRSQVETAVARTVERFGGLDHVVCVAGASAGTADLAATDDDVWRAMFELNLLGATRVLRAAEPALTAAAAAGRGATAVLVGSVNGLAAWGEEPYAVAKAGLVNLAANLAVRWGPRGIRINVVAPGTVRTRVWDGRPDDLKRLARAYPLGRVGEPAEVAAAIAFLASNDASWITGVTLPVDGGGSTGPRRLLDAGAGDG
ncbi:NAD(P)-dependent dehydrogenase (short-subunit alcohol dehydrogenase family) [Friedmanniella endophytica]|uniref:NAD(P)-dependent dehydrogenase (Short-subunit alcohol dehydrogenase family) n=1 Tax=Microlunatus kandeliicorticis TaxID=1759536 RepID=A0A7W3ITG2_9ACTN|nr:SDR family NAD(P)-dependent oxidoreductase [Microlunatus kandeliicorticis]MBA8794962.1 NAD(P)-dependent dehydrogenase (short-subunit alcohol dehydrogenase family) [Microlunatus kandeliicorticis]